MVHIEGKPYERGYQYGTLLAKEIGGFIEAHGLSQTPKAPSDGWKSMRTLTDALFLRRYDTELMEEMKGIADGAAAGGCKVFDRAVDFLDIVTVNSIVELGFLESALSVTPTGLEGKEFKEPPYARLKKVPMGHCSAFAATGPATKDGQLVIGHITMWSQYSARWFNVWLDVKPEKGHRVMMQTNPGGIMSGTDYYQNDKGLILSETTISQTSFNVNGWSLTARCRKAIQYAQNIDECVEQLSGQNNGLYTNEWLIGDAKTNEIAMFEMGTKQKKLWRSSKDEWPGNTPGFFWGCNNTKDLQVRLDTQICLDCRPANMTFRPSERDKMWLKLYDENKGKIDENFAFKAFTTPPLAAYPSLDVKFTTGALAKEFKSWGLFGPPLGRTWEPSDEDKQRYDFKVAPLVSNDWTMLSGESPKAEQTAGDVKSNSRAWNATAAASSADGDANEYEDSIVTERNPAWNGTLLPKTDADVWLTTGFADYERIVSKMKQKKTDKEAIALALYAHGIKYRMATQRLGKETTLTQLKLDPRDNDGYDQASGRGVLVLHKLRETLGAEVFDGALNQFGKAHAGKEVTTADFRTYLEKVTGKSLEVFFTKYVNQVPAFDAGKPVWSIFGWDKNLEDTIIVYGTQAESAANKEAAYRLQETIARRWGNYRLDILTDAEVKPEQLKIKNILLIGRPEANSVTAKLQAQFPVGFGPRSFKVGDANYAADQTGIIVAGPHPENHQRCIVAFMGLSAETTWKLVNQMGYTPCDALIVTSDGTTAKVLREVKLAEEEVAVSPSDDARRWLANYFAGSRVVAGEFTIDTEYDDAYWKQANERLQKENEKQGQTAVLNPAKQHRDVLWAHDGKHEIFHFQGAGEFSSGFYSTPQLMVLQVTDKNYNVESARGRPNHGSPGDFFLYFTKPVDEIISECQWTVTKNGDTTKYVSSVVKDIQYEFTFAKDELQSVLRLWRINGEVHSTVFVTISNYYKTGKQKYPSSAQMTLTVKGQLVWTKFIKATRIEFDKPWTTYRDQIVLPKGAGVFSVKQNRNTWLKEETPLKAILDPAFVFEEEVNRDPR